MEWTILIGCIIGAWSILSIMANERSSRLEQIQRAATPPPPEPEEVIEVGEAKPQ